MERISNHLVIYLPKSKKNKLNLKMWSKNQNFFNSLTTRKQGNNVLLVVNGRVQFKNPNLTKVIEKFSKIENKENKEISIITVPRNKSIMVV